MTRAQLTCAGRAVDRDGQPVGEPCGRRFKPPGIPVDSCDGGWPLWTTRAATTDETVARARAAGWAVGVLPDGTAVATCPSCRKPDPELTALCRDLQEGLLP